MIDKAKQSKINRIAKRVAKEIPFYIGVTGDALVAQIKKGIIKYDETLSKPVSENLIRHDSFVDETGNVFYAMTGKEFHSWYITNYVPLVAKLEAKNGL